MPERKILNSWKEIAAYLGKGVRTVQRYERELDLPVRRPAGKDRSAVLAFSDELDKWLNRSAMKTRPYVRPILVVVDPPTADTISNRKLALELAKFNVLTAHSLDEAIATTRRVEVDGLVVDCDGFLASTRICEELREQCPELQIFAVTQGDGKAPKAANHVVRGHNAEKLLECVREVFGQPRVE